MSDESKTAAALLTAVLLLFTFIGTVRAQEYDPRAATLGRPALAASERERPADERPPAERREAMIERCEREHGTDCEREVDTELRAEGLQQGARVIHLRPAR